MSSGPAARTCTSSARIIRLLAIEDALERREVRAGVFRRVGEQHAVRLAYDLASDLPERRAHATGQDLKAAGALEVVHEVEGFGDRRADHDDAMVGEEHDALAAERARQAVAFGLVDHQ